MFSSARRMCAWATRSTRALGSRSLGSFLFLLLLANSSLQSATQLIHQKRQWILSRWAAENE
jgi:hypothetical protein